MKSPLRLRHSLPTALLLLCLAAVSWTALLSNELVAPDAARDPLLDRDSISEPLAVGPAKSAGPLAYRPSENWIRDTTESLLLYQADPHSIK
jgi:hypothetical protein